MSLFNLRGIKKTFGSGKSACHALSNVNLTLPARGIVAIIGRSGSGKSTLLNILLGIERPSAGSVRYRGKDMLSFKSHDMLHFRQHEISMVFQHYNLFEDLSAYENVMLPLAIRGDGEKKAKEETDRIFAAFDLSQLKQRKTGTLSGGEKQRIAILRSVITAPRVILLDEPTGALDQTNARLIMDLLKKISLTRLIVIVTHDAELVDHYADEIITLLDGRIIKRVIKEPLPENITSGRTIKKKKIATPWRKTFIALHLRKHRRKNMLALFSLTLGLGAVLLAAGFLNGSNSASLSAQRLSLSYPYATIAKKTYFTVENSPLTYEKSVRPSYEEVNATLSLLPRIDIEPNLDHLFTPYPFGKYEKEDLDGFSLTPVHDMKALRDDQIRFLAGGVESQHDLHDVIINEEFVTLLHLSDPKEAVGKTFLIEHATLITTETGEPDEPYVRDTYSYALELRIIAVVREFSFLNLPRVYYSYPDVKRELAMTIMPNLSAHLGHDVTYLEHLLAAEDDAALSSYSYALFANDPKEAEALFALKEELDAKESPIRITSSSYDIKSAYEGFVDVLSKALIIFTLIIFLGVELILGIIALSSFIEGKKESAILSCLGAGMKTILSIHLSENLAVALLAIMLAFFLSWPASFLLNHLLSDLYHLENIIAIPIVSWLNVPFLFPLLTIGVAVTVCTLFIIVPLTFYKKISITDELRDE